MNTEFKIQQIAVLGSTGSIGTQTLDIIEENPDRFRAAVLTAKSNWELLARQARKFMPDIVVIADDSNLRNLREALSDLPVKVAAGQEAIAEAVELPNVDAVVTATVGYSGLIPTLHAIKAGKRICLANKETLVVAGSLITAMARRYEVEILPVDSEHSAIFQCLRGERMDNVDKIILTASGGPFRNWSLKDMEKATLKDALNHPNWSMGAKVTIDSASMMNKGFEMIEARWLFDMQPDKIEILVHPQSIVHSMVAFKDGSIKAQLGTPDMRIPISYALGFPDRTKTARPTLSLENSEPLTFETPDFRKFPLLNIAFEAINKGGNYPCILNAANEVAVEAFINGKINFVDIPAVVESTLERLAFIPEADLPDLISTNSEARAVAYELIKQL